MDLSRIKIAVALSGGVDSGTAAALLVKAGYQVSGVHLGLCSGRKEAANLKLVKSLAEKVKIPLKVLDCTKIFQKEIIASFIKAYAQGLTPNPCVLCNRQIKFGQLLNYIKKAGFDYLATGHYARIVASHQPSATGNRKLSYTTRRSLVTAHHLLQAKDKQKDQSYFLYRLNQNQLKWLVFPLADYTKAEVRSLAGQWQLPVAKSIESQNICFLGEGGLEPFLSAKLKGKFNPGALVNPKGEVIGTHLGLPFYTVGQRHGFRINNLSYQKKFTGELPVHYVIGKNFKKNQLIVGELKEAQQDTFWLKNLSFTVTENYFKESLNLKVKIRSTGRLLAVVKTKKEGKKIRVILKKPELGISPGQSVVFYQEFGVRSKELRDKKYKDLYEVVGGGEIERYGI